MQVLENGHTLILGWSNKVGFVLLYDAKSVLRCCPLSTVARAYAWPFLTTALGMQVVTIVDQLCLANMSEGGGRL